MPVNQFTGCIPQTCSSRFPAPQPVFNRFDLAQAPVSNRCRLSDAPYRCQSPLASNRPRSPDTIQPIPACRPVCDVKRPWHVNQFAHACESIHRLSSPNLLKSVSENVESGRFFQSCQALSDGGAQIQGGFIPSRASGSGESQASSLFGLSYHA